MERVVDVQLDVHVVVGHTVDNAQQVSLAGGRENTRSVVNHRG